MKCRTPHVLFIAPVITCWLCLHPAHAQEITTPPQNLTVAPGATATFSVATTGASGFQWHYNGLSIPGATSPTFTISDVQAGDTGIYTVMVHGASPVSASAILGLATTTKAAGGAFELKPDIVHPNGNTYDQFILTSPAGAIRADAGQISRLSYIDLSDDIVQIEFSGAGTLSVALASATGPAFPLKYNQDLAYMKGHAGIVVTGADETTNLSVFSVGTLTAVNTGLFPPGMVYDGIADISFVAISGTDGRFGGLRTSNASYFATAGLTGVFAPGVAFNGPLFVGDIDAFDAAQPVLCVGAAADARITGGSLRQANAQPVSLAGIAQLNYTAGTTSHGKALPVQINEGMLRQDGIDVTARVAFSGPTMVTIGARNTVADESGTAPVEFIFARTGSVHAPLTVNYGVSGSATNGIDYPILPGSITIPAGAASIVLTIGPFPDTSIEPAESVTLAIAAGDNYTVGTAGSFTATIADSPSSLYLATLRPAAAAQTSAASGLAALVLSASGTTATVHVSFSNLSSGQTGAHLFLGDGTGAGDFIGGLPRGQFSGRQWNIQPTATYTTSQILDALRRGLIYVGIDTAQHPAGELRGAFVSAIGSQVFIPPAAPPALSLEAMSSADAARLLTQATFGPRRSEIDALTGTPVHTWITNQMALPNSSHRARAQVELQFTPVTGNNNPNLPQPTHRQYAWFHNVLRAPDQLRQRVAFALSQIFVVSDVSLGGQTYADGLAHYYDILAEGAFGNYRALLEQVALSPIMGVYLSHLRNAKADPAAGTSPDENFAREIMQLFSIGLVQLQPDGTLKLDAQGLPIPTYNQSTISEMAKVFTGWSYFSSAANPNFRRGASNYIDPMMIFPAFHENSSKTIVGGIIIPADLGGREDLMRTLDALFQHPNTGPFISRQLIQRLVTANPSPAYVYRVAEKFADNGAGIRGDLGAVVRAILTDYEARSPAVADDPGYGKLKEPLLRLTGVLRSLNATSSSGHYIPSFANVYPQLNQAALRSPSVFNFFEPGYVYPGPLAAAGLVAPEFQITNDTTAISVPNLLRAMIFATSTRENAVTLDLAAEQALVANVPALLDHLALLMANGQLGPATRARIINALAALSAGTSPRERAQTAVLLIATSPEGATQR